MTPLLFLLLSCRSTGSTRAQAHTAEAPPYPAGLTLALPTLGAGDLPETSDVARVALAKDGVHLDAALVTGPGPLPLGSSTGGWSVDAWKTLDAGHPAVLAADAGSDAQDLVRLIASTTAPGESARVLVRAGAHIASIELALPKETDPARAVIALGAGGADVWKNGVHAGSGALADVPKLVEGAPVALSLDADRTVQDLVDAASALQAAGAPVVLDVSDSPCAPALDGMTCVPGGAAHVGGTAKNPAHAVRISTFYVDTAPVDAASYDACVSAGFCPPSPQGPSVGGVTWEAANRYCTWAGKRLPTEWEWEKAERAGAFSGPGATWTRTWMENDWAACGPSCAGTDPLGPCAGADPCPSSTLRVRRSAKSVGNRIATSPGAKLPTELRCVLSGSTADDPPAFFGRGEDARSPVLARLPALQTRADPGTPTPPTADELAAVRDLPFDAIEDKPVCGEEKVKSWNFPSGVGGRSEMDCRDPVTYIDTNETRLPLFLPFIENLGGAYAGVGADQSYDLIALAKSRWAFLFDYEPNVVRLHRVLEALVLASDSPDAFLARFAPEARDESMEIIAKQWAGDPQVGTYQRLYLGYQHRLAGIYARERQPRKDDARFGWLSHAEQYTYIRALYQQGRIVILPGDMLADKSMRSVGRAAEALHVPVRVFYTSNAPTSWGGNITPAWRANVAALPFDDASVVLVTWNHGAFGQKGYWHYNIQRALTYQSRLQKSGYTHMWQLAWDRIPGDDPDRTVTNLATATR